jgi:hypothetical protein
VPGMLSTTAMKMNFLIINFLPPSDLDRSRSASQQRKEPVPSSRCWFRPGERTRLACRFRRLAENSSQLRLDSSRSCPPSDGLVVLVLVIVIDPPLPPLDPLISPDLVLNPSTTVRRPEDRLRPNHLPVRFIESELDPAMASPAPRRNNKIRRARWNGPARGWRPSAAALERPAADHRPDRDDRN